MKPEPIFQFTVLSHSWYGPANLKDADYVEEICFGLYDPAGGCLGEATVRWYELQLKTAPAPRLEMFSDSWRLLEDKPELIEMFALMHNSDPSPELVAEKLRGIGFIDVTEPVSTR